MCLHTICATKKYEEIRTKTSTRETRWRNACETCVDGTLVPCNCLRAHFSCNSHIFRTRKSFNRWKQASETILMSQMKNAFIYVSFHRCDGRSSNLINRLPEMCAIFFVFAFLVVSKSNLRKVLDFIIAVSCCFALRIINSDENCRRVSMRRASVVDDFNWFPINNHNYLVSQLVVTCTINRWLAPKALWIALEEITSL